MHPVDTHLIEEYLIKKSSSACFTLVSRHQQSVFGMCYKILRNREEAEEAAQDVFIKFFDSLEKLKEPGKMKSWLLSIAYRTAIDHYRRKKPVMSDVDLIPEPATAEAEGPDQQFAKMESKALLEQLFSRMDVLDTSILTLYYLEDMTVKEIAETLHQTESNIKVRLMRARETLRGKMGPYYLKESKA